MAFHANIFTLFVVKFKKLHYRVLLARIWGDCCPHIGSLKTLGCIPVPSLIRQ